MTAVALEQQSPSSSELEILILAPTGQDAKLIASTLFHNQMSALACVGAESFCETIEKGAGALVIAEEALTFPLISRIRELLQAQEPWSDIPIVVMTAKGEGRLGSMRVLDVFAPSGNVTLLERPFRAITLISTLQVALRARKRQYQVRELLELQKQATRIRDEFISIASHELKTPLTSLKLQAQISKRMRDRSPETFSVDRVSKLLDATDTQVDRLTRLVEDMLDVSRISSGKLVIQKSRFDLCELVSEITERLMPQLNAVGCQVELACAVPLVGTWDRYRIEQVLNNLLTNAIRYSPGKPVRIEVSRQEDRAQLVVRDEGTGIAPDNLERIFDRFERAVQAKNISGLGLGLYICKQIVESHRGVIRVESELGKGSTFVVELPVA